MNIETKRKITTIIIVLVATIALLGKFLDMVKQTQDLEEAGKLGMAIDISPDGFQRDIRIILALVLSAMTLWSEKIAKIGLLSYFIFYTIVELLIQIVFPYKNIFSTTAIEIHLLPAIALSISLFVWWKKVWDLSVISLVAYFYILAEYLFWVLHTINAYRQAEATISSLTILFSGWHFWHYSIFIFTFLLLFWQFLIFFQIKHSFTIKSL
jgi:hypothetical protein